MNNKPYNHLKVDDGAFELDYISNTSELPYYSDSFKPHWNILLVRVSRQFSGTFEECIDWMSQFYIDRFDDARTADAQTLEFAKELVKEAETLQQYGRKLTKQEREWYDTHGAIHPREIAGYDEFEEDDHERTV